MKPKMHDWGPSTFCWGTPINLIVLTCNISHYLDVKIIIFLFTFLLGAGVSTFLCRCSFFYVFSLIDNNLYLHFYFWGFLHSL